MDNLFKLFCDIITTKILRPIADDLSKRGVDIKVEDLLKILDIETPKLSSIESSSSTIVQEKSTKKPRTRRGYDDTTRTCSYCLKKGKLRDTLCTHPCFVDDDGTSYEFCRQCLKKVAPQNAVLARGGKLPSWAKELKGNSTKVSKVDSTSHHSSGFGILVKDSLPDTMKREMETTSVDMSSGIETISTVELNDNSGRLYTMSTPHYLLTKSTDDEIICHGVLENPDNPDAIRSLTEDEKKFLTSKSISYITEDNVGPSGSI